MNRHVNAIAGRLSLRPPQRDSLAILDRLTEILPPKKCCKMLKHFHTQLLTRFIDTLHDDLGMSLKRLLTLSHRLAI